MLPKILSSIDLITNIKRNVEFSRVGIVDSFFVALNMLIGFITIDYSKLVSWRLGNWESMNCLMPGLFFIYFWKLRENKKILMIYLSLFMFFLLGSIFFVSGVYSEIIKQIPLIKSFHVNPRFVFCFNLSVFSVYAYFSHVLSEKWLFRFFYPIFIFIIMIYHLGYSNLGPNYVAYDGLDKEKNILSYCYEPLWGYDLQYLHSRAKKSFFREYIDPRCYLESFKKKCNDNFSISPKDLARLRSYDLGL
jgi:hypothetical protein